MFHFGVREHGPALSAAESSATWNVALTLRSAHAGLKLRRPDESLRAMFSFPIISVNTQSFHTYNGEKADPVIGPPGLRVIQNHPSPQLVDRRPTASIRRFQGRLCLDFLRNFRIFRQ